QASFRDLRISLGIGLYPVRADTAVHKITLYFVGMAQSCRTHQFQGAGYSLLMVIVYPDLFIGYDQPFIQGRILGSYTGWAGIAVAFKSLYTSQGKHHPPRRITHVGAQGKVLHQVET